MIGLVENAMLARLKAAGEAGVIPYGYRSFLTWPRNFDEFLSSETVGYPACWAAFGGAHKVERLSSGLWQAHCAFGLVVAAENRRNEQSRRHGGSASEPGSYQLATDALRLLAGQRLGLDITPLEPASIVQVETSDIPKIKQLSIYAVTFDTRLPFVTAPVLAQINAFDSFHADWDPAPFGHVSTPLPDDGPAIGADNIPLPGVAP